MDEIYLYTSKNDLDNAKLKRDIYLSKMVLEIKAIRTGEVDLIEPLAIDFQRKITTLKGTFISIVILTIYT